MTQTIVNLGTGGAVLNGRNGSTTGADSNDALFLDWTGLNYVYLPGVLGNSLTVPDSAALDITGDIDIRVRFAPEQTGLLTGIANKRGGLSTEYSWVFYYDASRNLVLSVSTDGASQLDSEASSESTVALPTFGGSDLWVRATLDVDDGAGNRVYSYFTSTDGVSWLALGTPRTIAGTTSIYSSTTDVGVGFFRPGQLPLPAKVYRFQIFNGIDGTKVLDIDTSVLTSGAATTFTALTGQTVTINRSTAGRKSVAVVSPVWLFCTDDYMEVADNDLIDFGATDSFTVLAVIRQWATPANNGVIIGKSVSSVTGPAYLIRQNGTSFFTFNQTLDSAGVSAFDSGNTYLAGVVNSLSMVVNRSTQQLTAYVGGTAAPSPSNITTVGSLVNVSALRIGGRSTQGGLPCDMELLAVAVFRRALTATEISRISAYYQSRLS